MIKIVKSPYLSVLFFFVIFIGFYASANEGPLYRDRSVQEAVELKKKLVLSDEGEKSQIFSSFKQLVEENTENSVVMNMYINSLIAERHYQVGLSELMVMNKKNLTRTHLLTQCMLQERLKERDEDCYKKVIALSEENNVIDSDYISALFFMGDKRFEKVKRELIKDKKFTESDFLVFTLGKEKMLHEFFP